MSDKIPDPALTILLVDDSGYDNNLAQIAIREAKLATVAQVRFAVSATEAMQIIENETVPDLIITDLCMPRLDGKDLLHGLKSNALYRHIPIFILTNSDYQQHIDECLSAGADAYIEKPSDISEFIEFFRSLRQVISEDGKPAADKIHSLYGGKLHLSAAA